MLGDRDRPAVGCVFGFVALQGVPFDEAGIGGVCALSAALRSFSMALYAGCMRKKRGGTRLEHGERVRKINDNTIFVAILQVLPYAWKVDDKRDPKFVEFVGRTDTA